MTKITSIRQTPEGANKNYKPNSKINCNNGGSLFSDNCKAPLGDNLKLSSKVTPPPDGNDTIPAMQQPDTLRFFANPKDMVVVEFYSNGKPHYVKNFYDNIIIQKREYEGDGTLIAVDVYTNGILRKHTENYPGSGEPWIVQEYDEKGKLLRVYEYAPHNKLIDYRAFPIDE